MNPCGPSEPFQRRLREIAERRAAQRASADARGPSGIPGDVIVVRAPVGQVVEWVVVESVGAESLVVPIDDRALRVPGDVRVGPADDPRAVRTIASVMVPAARVEGQPRSECLSAEDVSRVLLACRSVTRIDPSDLDDEEIHWAATVVRASRALRELLRGDPVVVRLDEIVDPARALVPAELRTAGGSASALAAASRRPVAAFVELEHLGHGDGLVIEDLWIGLAGRIRLVASARGVGLLCEPDDPEMELPSAGTGIGGAACTLGWELAPGGLARRVWIDVDWRAERPVLWIGDKVALAIEIRDGGVFNR